MENLFIRNDQYNFIKYQLETIIRAKSSVKDQKVIDAVKLSAYDKVIGLFSELNESQSALLSKITEIDEESAANHFLEELTNYLAPFKQVTEKTVAKLFPKLKKLKAPALDSIDFYKTSYLGWFDIRLDRKLLIVEYDNKLIGIQGTFRESKKGICSICNKYEEIGLFMSIVKKGNETYTSRGNYICKDSHKCNENIMSLDRLNNFINVIKTEKS